MEEKYKANYPFLNEVELEELQKFADNQTLQNAVRKVLLQHVYYNGVLREGEHDTFGANLILAEMSQPIWDNAPIAEYGMQVKALINATKLVLTGFSKFIDFKKVEPVPEKTKNRGK